jgi:hypothetical protein
MIFLVKAFAVWISIMLVILGAPFMAESNLRTTRSGHLHWSPEAGDTVETVTIRYSPISALVPIKLIQLTDWALL